MEEPNELKVEVGDLIEYVIHKEPKEYGIGYVDSLTKDYFVVKWINGVKSEAGRAFWYTELAAAQRLDPKYFSFRVVNDNQRLYFPLEI